MKKTDGIHIGIADVGKRRSRSALTGVAIAVGCMLLVAMQGMGGTINNTASDFIKSFGDMSQVIVFPEKYDEKNNFALQFQEQSQKGMQLLPYSQNVQINPEEKQNTKNITDKTLKKLSKLPNVKNLVAYEMSSISGVQISGVEKAGASVSVMGYNSAYQFNDQVKIVAGSDLSGNQDGVLVKKEYLEEMGVEDFSSVIGKEITLKVAMPMQGQNGMAPKEIKKVIEGVYENKNAYYPGSLMGLDGMTNEIQAYYLGIPEEDVTPHYAMTTLNTKDEKEIESLMDEINSDLGYATFNLKEVLGLAAIFTGFVSHVLDIGAIIVLIVAGVGLVNTMTMTVQEKKKWIGIMRSIGAGKNNISTIFMAQAVFIGTVGAVLGCLLAFGGIELINMYLESSGKAFVIQLTKGNILFGFFVTVVISAVAGMIPARRAARLDVTEIINED